MSKCMKCGRELLTGDIHFQEHLCNRCFEETFNQPVKLSNIDNNSIEAINVAEYLLFIEDGSVDIEELKKQLRFTNIITIFYRAGSQKPELVKIKGDKK